MSCSRPLPSQVRFERVQQELVRLRAAAGQGEHLPDYDAEEVRGRSWFRLSALGDRAALQRPPHAWQLPTCGHKRSVLSANEPSSSGSPLVAGTA